jgi:hypothetical protein
MSLDTFEQSLLSELRQHVVARTPARPTARRRWTARVAVGGLATAGAAAVALSLGTGVVGPSAAYAVESEPNGDVVVTVHNLADASGLEHALAAKGVHANVTYIAGFSQAGGGEKRTPSGDDRAACDIALAKIDGGLQFTLGAAQIANGSTLDIVTSGSSPTDVGSPVEVAWSGGAC